jgi:hypothetical protein
MIGWVGFEGFAYLGATLAAAGAVGALLCRKRAA